MSKLVMNSLTVKGGREWVDRHSVSAVCLKDLDQARDDQNAIIKHTYGTKILNFFTLVVISFTLQPDLGIIHK